MFKHFCYISSIIYKFAYLNIKEVPEKEGWDSWIPLKVVLSVWEAFWRKTLTTNQLIEEERTLVNWHFLCKRRGGGGQSYSPSFWTGLELCHLCCSLYLGCLGNFYSVVGWYMHCMLVFCRRVAGGVGGWSLYFFFIIKSAIVLINKE